MPFSHVKSSLTTCKKGAAMDEKLVDLFRQWLKAFEVAQDAMSDDFAHKAVAELETRIVATPAEGLRGLVVKLGLHKFLSDQADATSLLFDSAYSDLVRLTGLDPATDIAVEDRILLPTGHSENLAEGLELFGLDTMQRETNRPRNFEGTPG
jgi:hypothetical protein